MEQMQFRISSFLKDLIGRELITDEFVAVFELVKNSFDANAKKVKVIFKNQNNPATAKIIIQDDGRGMDYENLKNKWLFVAHSAKRDGSENKDYRDKIQNRRIFAGAKGVGRFSCDRLGKNLNMITIKNEKNAKIENLIVDWTSFEEDSNKEFIDIKVSHNVLQNTNYPNFTKGTILEITGLRDVWNRERLKKLKFSLEKLINPMQKNDVNNFSIEIIAKDELIQDKNEKIEQNQIKLHFKDDGCGIPSDIISHIFEYRFSTTKGGGLGLYHVKEIISKMKGQIEVNNNLNEGLEFILTFIKQ